MTKKKAKAPVKKAPEKERFKPADHWKGMPEFIQPEAGPIKSLTVNFATKEDMHKFSKMIGQKVTAQTRSVWYPVVPEETAIDKRYSDSKKAEKR